LKRVNDEISIKGMAESNNRISALMRNFESSEWFASPNLKDVSAVSKGENALNSFDLTVKQVTPVIKSDVSTSNSGKGAK
jgi:type IV pilus assembly protein PilN